MSRPPAVGAVVDQNHSRTLKLNGRSSPTMEILARAPASQTNSDPTKGGAGATDVGAQRRVSAATSTVSSHGGEKHGKEKIWKRH